MSIVEASDATPAQLAIREANSSIYVFRASALWPAIDALTPANTQGELYLTDAVRGIVEGGGTIGVHEADDPAEAEGVDARVELAAATAALRDAVNVAHMLEGVTIVDPASTWIEPTVALEADSVVHPFTVLRGATTVAAGASVGPRVVAIDAAIGPGSLVGTVLLPSPRHRARGFGEGHPRSWSSRTPLSGRAPRCRTCRTWATPTSAQGSNVGAGSITANLSHHPERGKSRTRIGRDVKVAVDALFVAPVTLGDDAWTAPGTVVTDDVPAEARSSASRRARESRRAAVEIGTIEQALPGLEQVPAEPAMNAGRAPFRSERRRSA